MTSFKFRFTLVVDYEGKLEHYEGAETPEEMAAMDLASVKGGILSPYDFITGAPSVEKIEVLCDFPNCVEGPRPDHCGHCGDIPVVENGG